MECQVKGITINYEEFGSGRPFIGLHGQPADHRHMVSDYEPLFASRPGWRRIYPDMPGMGRTKAADWITSQDQMLEIMLAFIDTIASGERFILGGSSYGGYMARGVVYHREDQMDGVMLSVPVIKRGEEKRRLPKHRIIHQEPAFLNSLRPDEDLAEFLVAQTVEAVEASRENIEPAVAIADHAFLEKMEQKGTFTFPVDSLPRPFEAPALIVTGRFDHWCGYADAYDLLDQYPRATFAVLDRAGHALGVEEKALFQSLGRDWLDRVEEYIQDKKG